MKYFHRFLSHFKKIFLDSGDYIIYTYYPTEMEEHYLDPNIKTYSKYCEIPDFIKKKLSLYPLFSSLYYRIKSQQAILLSIHNDTEIISYGWVQSWKPFKRKFGWMFQDAVMLGPYWTNSLYRGQGFYGRLLKHSLTISSKDSQIFIYTTPENISSQKGIEKNCFKKVGIYRVHLALRFFQWHKKIS